jgi:hypothetical protein
MSSAFTGAAMLLHVAVCTMLIVIMRSHAIPAAPGEQTISMEFAPRRQAASPAPEAARAAPPDSAITPETPVVPARQAPAQRGAVPAPAVPAEPPKPPDTAVDAEKTPDVPAAESSVRLAAPLPLAENLPLPPPPLPAEVERPVRVPRPAVPHRATPAARAASSHPVL